MPGLSKVVSVDNIRRNDHFSYKDVFLKIKILEIAKELLSNF